MTFGFKVGDTVNAQDGNRVIQGEVTRIRTKMVEDVETGICVEVKRPGGSCIEIPADSEGTFDHITKAV